MKYSFILICWAASFFLGNTASVSACSCIEPLPPRESLKQTTAVFAGKVVKVAAPSSIAGSSADPVKVTFAVSRIWQGPDHPSLIVTTARDGASCGYYFQQNEEYIVYAYGEPGALRTGLCSRTKLLADAQEDLQDLGVGQLPK